jgi:bifunctional non-homologous end joining protein LigD
MPSLSDIKPMAFTEVQTLPTGPEWTYEIKYDGYRVLAGTEQPGVRLKTRNGADCTGWFVELAAALGKVRGEHVFDGEVCVLDEVGRSNFELLQDRARARRYREGLSKVVYCVFDLLVCEGADVRSQPLADRQAALEVILSPLPPSVLLVRGTQDGAWLWDAVGQLALEGVVAKRLDSPYRSGVRSNDWRKVKRPGAIPAQRFKR